MPGLVGVGVAVVGGPFHHSEQGEEVGEVGEVEGANRELAQEQ